MLSVLLALRLLPLTCREMATATASGMFLYVHTHTYVYTHVYVYIFICVYVCVCVFVCVSVFVCVCVLCVCVERNRMQWQNLYIPSHTLSHTRTHAHAGIT
jgi:hypothetical protein